MGLPPKELKEYKQLLRDFHAMQLDMDTLVTKVKQMFKSQDRFFVLKVR